MSLRYEIIAPATGAPTTPFEERPLILPYIRINRRVDLLCIEIRHLAGNAKRSVLNVTRAIYEI